MINWKEQSEGDYIAIEGDYMLRVEQINESLWWWELSINGEEVEDSFVYWESIAKKQVEQAMNKHLKLK